MGNFATARMERILRIMRSLNFLDIINNIQVEREAREVGIRFFHVLTQDRFGKVYFLKILADSNNEEAKMSLLREIIVSRSIANQLNGQTWPDFSVASFFCGITGGKWGKEIYLVMDGILPPDAGVGFIVDESEMEKLTIGQAGKFVNSLIVMNHRLEIGNILHEAYVEMRNHRLESPLDFFEMKYQDFREFRSQTLAIMSIYVNPVDRKSILLPIRDSGVDKISFWRVLQYRLGIEDLYGKILKVLDKCESVINSFQYHQDFFLVHGDLCPRNCFFAPSGEIFFLDWGHAWLTRNPLLAFIHDFGNMRARAWNNKIFRNAMDEAVLLHWRSLGDENVGRIVVILAILRSHALLAGFFENYDQKKQLLGQEKRRRESTELDLLRAFEILGVEI